MQKPPIQVSTSASVNDRRKWYVLLAIGIGTFMSALDGSVVNTILPVVRGAFNSDVAAIEWVVVVYLLVVSGLLLTFGRLGDLRGHRKVYLTGFGIFIVSSALCGLATSAQMLVAFRGLQAHRRGHALLQLTRHPDRQLPGGAARAGAWACRPR